MCRAGDIFYLVFGDRVPHWSVTHSIGWLGWPPGPRRLSVHPSPAPGWDYKHLSPCSPFKDVGSGDQAQVLMLTRQALYLAACFQPTPPPFELSKDGAVHSVVGCPTMPFNICWHLCSWLNFIRRVQSMMNSNLLSRIGQIGARLLRFD